VNDHSASHVERRFPILCVTLLLACPVLATPFMSAAALRLAAEDETRGSNTAARQFFEIRVVDKGTRRGIPMVELTTVDGVRYVTDSAGRIAYEEGEHAGRTIFFHVRPQGYEVPKDGFGIEGVRCKIELGKSAVIALARTNVAERLYRCTGQGIYRDSVLLGHDVSIAHPLGVAQVAGQDSVQAAVYRGRVYWFWGDTSRLSYPLGLFRTAGATSLLAAGGGLDPALGVNYDYFTGKDGFVRAMVDVADPKGVVWIDGVATVPDASGREHLVAHFSRRPGLEGQYEHGMLVYNDDREVFEARTTLPLDDTWRFLNSHPTRVANADGNYLMFGAPFLSTRVPATLEAVLDPDAYESWSCLDGATGPDGAEPRRDDAGVLLWQWQKSPPVTQRQERRWLNEGRIKAAEARFLPADSADPSRRVTMHSGTVRWNVHRGRWILVAIEIRLAAASPSMLGEVWYAESESPQGPFPSAVRIATHDKQSFYNPCQHPFFDEEGGRVIYFEGTYCNTFTHSPATPRYNYNQLMYRLDLDHPTLSAAFPR